jgi:DNA invertase Pin-like site-specific DNA recombinase
MTQNTARKVLRCAIYTRKSREEGLEQAFNSLDAQREACEAYITSQKHEGWTVLPEFYDDGGFSGGSMERPGLTRLLADIAAKRIDVVVVYKVDRLTRALADFARIVDIFDAAGVSFVSVTQQFNTTTSMGRLTLNVLLSFAQFEREVTAERIRDKIAASKKKGMWMGGVPPLGYKAENRQLVPVPEEAALVRRIFERYLALGSVRRLQAELANEGILTPVRISRSGKRSGGAGFSRGKLYWVLSNPVVIGKIRHREHVYCGQHAAILDEAIWLKAKTVLADNRFNNHEVRSNAKSPSPLAGRLFDPAGERMRPIHARKSDKRYRYYVSRDLIESSVETGASGWRIPAREIESAVAKAIIGHLKTSDLASAAITANQEMQDAAGILGTLAEIRNCLHDPGSTIGRTVLRAIVVRVDLSEERLCMTIDLQRLGKAGKALVAIDIPPFEITAPITLARRGAELKLVLRGAAGDPPLPDKNLLQTVIEARLRFAALVDPDRPATISDIASTQGADIGDVSRSLQLAFLAPGIVEEILDGRQPVGLTATRLRRLQNLPLMWDDQRKLLS